jgi:hypothetical protein
MTREAFGLRLPTCRERFRTGFTARKAGASSTHKRCCRIIRSLPRALPFNDGPTAPATSSRDFMTFELRPNLALCSLQKPSSGYHHLSPFISFRAPPLDCWPQNCLPRRSLGVGGWTAPRASCIAAPGLVAFGLRTVDRGLRTACPGRFDGLLSLALGPGTGTAPGKPDQAESDQIKLAT